MAREFMKTAPIEAIEPYYEADMIEMFKGGVSHVLSLPLAERLTDEEREKVRELYNVSKDIVSIEDDDTNMFSMHTQIMIVLESIFGSQIGKEGEV